MEVLETWGRQRPWQSQQKELRATKKITKSPDNRTIPSKWPWEAISDLFSVLFSWFKRTGSVQLTVFVMGKHPKKRSVVVLQWKLSGFLLWSPVVLLGEFGWLDQNYKTCEHGGALEQDPPWTDSWAVKTPSVSVSVSVKKNIKKSALQWSKWSNDLLWIFLPSLALL